MNKVETKKHWYDKPIKFLFFFLALFPIFLLLGNYISCEISFSQSKKTSFVRNNTSGNITYINEGNLVNDEGSILIPEEYENYNYLTPLESALLYTNLYLTGFNKIYAQEENYSTWGDYLLQDANLPILSPLSNFYYQLTSMDGASDPDQFFPNQIMIYPTSTLAVWSLWEIQLVFYYILLKVILFLPNVICYLLDWVERRLGKL